MSERLCLRCDWTGDADGPACPRCAAPLYRPSPPGPRESVTRSAPGPAAQRGRSVETARDDQGLAKTVRLKATDRWAVIVLALVVLAAGFALARIRDSSTEPSPLAEPAGQPTPVGSPSPEATPSPEPGPCSARAATVRGLAPRAEATQVAAGATADYRFEGTLESWVRTAPDLLEIGRGISAFSDEGMIGRAVLSFAGGRGLSLAPTTGIIGDSGYTIELLFRLDRLDGLRKLVDLRDGAEDDGLYLLDGCLVFSPRKLGGPTRIEADRYVQVVLTRDASARVVGYVDGLRQFAFHDADGIAEVLPSGILRFFGDDRVTGGGYSDGAVSQIRLFDRPLTEDEVAALACAELRVPLAILACRGPGG